MISLRATLVKLSSSMKLLYPFMIRYSSWGYWFLAALAAIEILLLFIK
jgi:hypothetical protein